MPEQIKGLVKRKDSILFTRNGKNIGETDNSINQGDIVKLLHEKNIMIDVFVTHNNKEGEIVGNVIQVSGKELKYSADERITIHEDFVFIVKKPLTET